MSEVAAPPPAQGFEGRTVKPWAKIAIWGAVGAGITALAVLTTGNIPFLHRSQPRPEAAKVSMTGPVNPLVRPAQPMADAAPLPKVATPPLLAAIAPASDDHTKAFESPIGIYQIKANASTGVQTAAKTGSGDIDTVHGELPADGTPDALEASLVPTKMDGTRVAELPNPRWLIEAGRLLSCVQVTKIDSTLPGAVTAIIPDAVRGETGDVVLLPKGARVFGTVQHGLLNGLDRLAVLWQHITTPVLYDDRGMPHQFRVAVNSPASSELGETGINGEVNRHLWKKLGGIIGISLIQGAIQAGTQAAANAAQRSGNGNTSLNFNSFGQSGQSAADELLRSWVEIPDIITRDQGTTCGIYVVRDLDMHGAYQLTQRYRP
jgi:type IV secretion system protein VirB10